MTALKDKLMPGQGATQPQTRIKQNLINKTDQQRIATIKSGILAEGDRIRSRYPILKHQDAIGMAILLASIAGIAGTAFLYLDGLLAWFITIPVLAIFMSFTHELEHDLIHYMYFRKNKVMHNLMMALVWICRPSTINPWARRHLHLHHHKHSGTETDLEERAITNGEPWNLKRVLMMFDLELSVVLRIFKLPKKYRIKAIAKGAAGNFPLATVFWATWHAYVAFWAVEAAAYVVGYSVPWPTWVTGNVELANTVAVLVFAPNLLRSFSINFISSNMHYFGDIEDGNFVQQCQVLNKKRFIIPHLFCFNFGSTHAIHHFVVRDPFYIRQMTAKRAHEVMRENGVRFNDLGTFTRSNRWTGGEQAEATQQPQGQAA